MILHFSNVTFSQYHARYSPLTVQFFTVTFFACQNASLVSNEQSSNVEFSIYWNEYFPLRSTFLNRRSVDLIIKYSLSAVQSVISIPFTDQPNSGEIISQPRSEDFVGIPQLDVGSVVKGDLYDMVVVNPILIEIRME